MMAAFTTDEEFELHTRCASQNSRPGKTIALDEGAQIQAGDIAFIKVRVVAVGTTFAGNQTWAFVESLPEESDKSLSKPFARVYRALPPSSAEDMRERAAQYHERQIEHWQQQIEEYDARGGAPLYMAHFKQAHEASLAAIRDLPIPAKEGDEDRSASPRSGKIERLLANPCVQKLEPDEPFFVLLGRDEHAAASVNYWALIRDGERGVTPKTTEARQIASDMRGYAKARSAGSHNHKAEE